MNNILKIENLDVLIEKKQILKNFELTIGANEIHILLGPNGSGKSTFLKVLAGHPSYLVEKGKIDFNNKNLLMMSPEIRSHEGLFLAFQSPIEISGVSNYDFLRIAYNEKQKYMKQKELDPLEFMELIQIFLNMLKMKGEFLNRNLNEGFSGEVLVKKVCLQCDIKLVGKYKDGTLCRKCAGVDYKETKKNILKRGYKFQKTERSIDYIALRDNRRGRHSESYKHCEWMV